jgi:sarcosine oxidase, subunit gamma
MADLPAVRRPPEIPATSGLRLLAPSARFILRAHPHAIRSAGAALGIEVAQLACRASQGGARAALWLGPDEYLILAPDGETPALARLLEEALRNEPHSLVDVSHRQTALEIRGPRVEDILNSACPLDLGLRAFAVGMCTRTVFAKAEFVLWRTAADVFRLEVWRSFTDYVARFLDEVAGEY